MSRLAGQILTRPRLYRGLEPSLRWLQKLGPIPGPRLAGWRLAPASFHRARQVQNQLGGPQAETPDRASGGPGLGVPGKAIDQGRRDGSLPQPRSLLRRAWPKRAPSATRAAGRRNWPACWRRSGNPCGSRTIPGCGRPQESLSNMGVTPHFAGSDRELAGETAVIVGLGAIPETGTRPRRVRLRPGRGPGLPGAAAGGAGP